MIGICLTVIGIVHDAAVAPERQPEFTVIRVIVASIGLLVLALMATSWGKENVRKLNFIWILIPQVMLGYMVFLTGGFSSSYARGFVFVLIASSLFPILSFRQSMTVVVATLLMYIGASFAGSVGSVLYGDVLSASMHITSLLFICGTARLFLERTFETLGRYEGDLKSTLHFVEEKMEELAHQKAVAVHQDKMTSIGNVIAGMLLKINHPVNYALWAVDTALRVPSVNQSADLLDPLADVKQALTSINTSMAGLRQFATPQGMDTPHDAVDCNFLELVQSAIKLLGNDLQNIILSVNIPSNLIVRCDRTAFLSVFMGLLSNAKEALEARSPNNPRILIEAHVVGDRVHVDVADNGIGMEQEMIPQIFSPFFTTDKSGKKLGLGLSIAYGEIVRHGGTVAANSNFGEGTTIRFELPINGTKIGPVLAPIE